MAGTDRWLDCPHGKHPDQCASGVCGVRSRGERPWNTAKLDSLKAWMVANHCHALTFEGITIALDDRAFDTAKGDDETSPAPWDDGEEPETPQARIRREFAARELRKAQGDEQQ